MGLRSRNPASAIRKNPEVKGAIDYARSLKSSRPLYITRQPSGGLAALPKKPLAGDFIEVAPDGGKVAQIATNPETGQVEETTIYKGRQAEEDGELLDDSDSGDSESWW